MSEETRTENSQEELSEILRVRREKLDALREAGATRSWRPGS